MAWQVTAHNRELCPSLRVAQGCRDMISMWTLDVAFLSFFFIFVSLSKLNAEMQYTVYSFVTRHMLSTWWRSLFCSLYTMQGRQGHAWMILMTSPILNNSHWHPRRLLEFAVGAPLRMCWVCPHSYWVKWNRHSFFIIFSSLFNIFGHTVYITYVTLLSQPFWFL